MLNYIKMKPGDAIFLAAGEPHAYVSGGTSTPCAPPTMRIDTTTDIVECMATSDNVIRAGLTPKLRDIPNLVGGLTYQAAAPTQHIVQPRQFATPQQTSPHSTLYDPPIPEFSVLRVVLAAGEEETHGPIDGPSVAIVTEGTGGVQWSSSESLRVSEGEVFFVGAGTELKLASTEGQNLVVYRAFVEA